jgi:hypothetical protein
MLFHKLFDTTHVNALPAEDPLKLIGENTGVMFTYLVDVLRKPETFPDPHINKLMTLTWRLVGNNITPAAVTAVPSLHFYYELQGKNAVAMFACPQNWCRQCVERRVFCMGGLVWASSQCRDAWNGRMRDREDVLMRAKAYESQFLHVMKTREDFKPDDYQSEVMKAFPGGVGDVSNLLYEGRPYLGAS